MSINDNTEIYTNYYNWLIDHKQIPKYYKNYLEHVLEHKKMVYIAWIYIVDILYERGFINENDIDEINELVLIHDNSKFQLDEFIPYAKRFNSPRKNNQQVKANFKNAVKLHKERNLHHFESLKQYKGKNWKHYAIELICDYIAMGWEFDSYVNDYFEKVKDELKNNLPENYYNYIESIIKIIPEELYLSNKPLTRNIIDYINYIYNRYNSPFDEEENIKELKKARMF